MMVFVEGDKSEYSEENFWSKVTTLLNPHDTRQESNPGHSGLEKSATGRPGQVDSPSGQVTFHSHLLQWAGDLQAICQLNP